MSLSLILGALWVVASAATAMLPYERQFPPGIALLIAAPFLLVFIGWQHGPWIVLFAVFAFASMFRNPLIHIARKYLGIGRRPDFSPSADRTPDAPGSSEDPQ